MADVKKKEGEEVNQEQKASPKPDAKTKTAPEKEVKKPEAPKKPIPAKDIKKPAPQAKVPQPAKEKDLLQNTERMEDKSKYKCLIIDDDNWNHRIINQYLQKYKIETFDAEKGFEGLNIAVNEDIDLIFLDLVLPDVAGGVILEVLRNLDVTKDIPIVVLSANIDVGIIKLAHSYNVKHFISKPYKEEIVIDKVRNIFYHTLLHDAATLVVQKQVVGESMLMTAFKTDEDTPKKLIQDMEKLNIVKSAGSADNYTVLIKSVSEVDALILNV
jgi:response regulator RpfG family c-di-GMP phosphodiesterase